MEGFKNEIIMEEFFQEKYKLFSGEYFNSNADQPLNKIINTSHWFLALQINFIFISFPDHKEIRLNEVFSNSI